MEGLEGVEVEAEVFLGGILAVGEWCLVFGGVVVVDVSM